MAEPIATAEQLAAAREARGLTVDDMTRHLKLAPRQVVAVESGDWAALPGLAFVRGILRGYGRILQVDVGPLIASVTSTVGAADLRPAASLDQPMPRQSMFGFASGGSGSRLAWVVLVLVAIVALALFFGGGDNLGEIRSWLGRSDVAAPADETPAEQSGKGTTVESVTLPQAPGVPPAPGVGAPAPAGAAPGAALPDAPPSAGPGAPPAAASPAPAAGAPVPAAGAPGTPAPGAQAAGAATAGAAPAAPADGAASPAGARALRLSFGRDAWIEAKDARGRVLVAGTQRAATVREVPVDGPVSLVIGNADAVKVELDGRTVDLGPHIRGTVARLSVR